MNNPRQIEEITNLFTLKVKELESNEKILRAEIEGKN